MAKLTPLQRRVAARTAAMPEVKRLVKKYGRATIASCLVKIHDREKAADKLTELRREIARLERRA